MKDRTSRWWMTAAGMAASALAPGLAQAAAANETTFVAVASQVSKDYVRAKLPDGSYQPETYVFGRGGYLRGGINDPTIDQMSFLQVLRTIQPALTEESYLNEKDPGKTKLLIMVYWGTTTPPIPEDVSPEQKNLQEAQTRVTGVQQQLSALPPTSGTTPGMAGDRTELQQELQAEQNTFNDALAMMNVENKNRDEIDFHNAELLGYDSWWKQTQNFEGTPWDDRRQDMLDELEEPRYFVVLMAYDFPLLWKEKKHKLLWVTRFSIRERDNAFDKQLAAMAEQASRYFGQDSDGLTHKPLPKAKVELGPMKVLGTSAPTK